MCRTLASIGVWRNCTRLLRPTALASSSVDGWWYTWCLRVGLHPGKAEAQSNANAFDIQGATRVKACTSGGVTGAEHIIACINDMTREGQLTRSEMTTFLQLAPR